MRGIISAAGYVPYRRLQRAEIKAFMGTGGGKGTRSVASHDEDTTTMGFEAARLALRSTPASTPEALWFATATPAYLDKTNAAAIHAALRLPHDVAAFDFGGALRSGVGALVTALRGNGTTLIISADTRDGLPTSTDESGGGDAASAFVVGNDTPGAPVLAEYLGGASATDEFTDRWRSPGSRRSKSWEERFGETRYVPLGRDVFARALKEAGLSAEDVDRVVVTGMHARAIKAVTAKLGVAKEAPVDDLTSVVGQAGTAQPGLVLASALESTGEPDQVIVVIHLADGADAVVLRTTAALAHWNPGRPIAAQLAAAADLPYAKFLSWRDQLSPEPPRRPEPARVSSSAAGRSGEWKFGFVGSKDRSSGAIHLPPVRVSMAGGAVDDMESVPMAGVLGTVVTFTVDHTAYSPSPPIVFAVVDFDGGGRFPIELTDVAADEVVVGTRIEMTFRRLFTADDIHDYFWKGRPVRGDAASHKEGAA